MVKSSSERLNIAYVTATNARDKHSWSGTDYYIWNALQKNVGDITLIQPKEPALLIFFLKMVHGASLYIFGKRFDWRHSTLLAKAYAKRVAQMLKSASFDLIVAPASDTLIAYLDTPVPIIYINDRTIAGAMGYHKMLSNLWGFSREQSVLTDKKAIENSLFVTYPSDWASQSAITQYKVSTEKVKTIHFGANIDEIPLHSIVLQRKKGNTCRLLFIGVNWKDKGGEIAYACLLELLKAGIDAQLTVVGCTPPDEFKHEKLRVIPFLNKNDKKEFEQLKMLWINSTFLILPTRIDAFGIVFCEAAAYGLPSLGTDTGGVGGALHNGKNGYLLPFSAGGKEYAARIATVFNDEEAYLALVNSTRAEFEKELNWERWAERIKEVLRDKL